MIKNFTDNKIEKLICKISTLILIDDINMGSGKAFKKFLIKNKLTGYSFRTLGAILIEKNEKLIF